MAKYCKYKKMQQRVSYDNGVTWTRLQVFDKGDLIERNSADCGYTQLYRWTLDSDATQYECSGTTKCRREIKQISTDNGTTWENVSPLETRPSSVVIEYNSTDCGYVPPLPSDPTTSYLTFIARESGNFSFESNEWIEDETIEYSLDGGTTWNTLLVGALTPTVQQGKYIMWKRVIERNRSIRFDSTAPFDVRGNILSIAWGDSFLEQTTMPFTSTFNSLFQNSMVVDASELILPSTTVTACYAYMFDGCEILTNAPELLATTLSNNCYRFMFQGCISLRRAPELMATTLKDYCYENMFAACSSLNYVKAMFVNKLDSALEGWMDEVASSGTFIKNANATWTESDVIPSGWTVQTE